MSEITHKAYCNKCCGDRLHTVLHTERVEWEEEVDTDVFFSGCDKYELIKCCGCENIALRHKAWNSEEIDERGNPAVTTTYYPPQTYRSEPKWISQLFWALPINNNFVSDLIKEIYIALRNGSLRLAVMGIRALIEQTMIDKVGDHGSFKKNLDAFQDKGFVSSTQRKILEPVLEAGHATMHRSFQPTKYDIGVLMDLTEHIVEAIYVNEQRAAQVSKRIPPRSKQP